MKKRLNVNQSGMRIMGMRLDSGGRPASLDENTRSVEIVAATETDQVMVFDWELGWVPEILLLSGCRAVTQAPLLDTHSRVSVADVLGSLREFRAEGDELLARAYYSTVPAAEEAYTKTREGHLTDYSVGFYVITYLSVAAGESATYEGRTFAGPCLVAVDWQITEVSTCPIGADNRAKARTLEPNDKEDMTMKEFLRMMRGKLGLPEDATEDQVRAAIEEAAKSAAVRKAEETARAAGVEKPDDGKTPEPPADPAAAARKAVAEERARVSEITALCEAHGCRELVAALTAKDTSVAEAQRQVLAELKKRADNPTPGFRVEVTATERDKFRAAAVGALLLNGNITVKDRQAAPGETELRGYSLKELARESLLRVGHSPSGDIRDVVGRALTTSDLPNILSNVAHQSVMAGFEAAEETYEAWTDTSGNLADFKETDLVRRGETSNLQEVAEDGEFKYGKTADIKETTKLRTFGEIIPISRQAIINDNLGLLTDIPRDMGEACARLQGDLAYGVLIANAKMADGKALFHSAHGNLAASGGSVSLTTLNAGDLAMGLQKDLLGLRVLNTAPLYFIAPRSLKGLAEQFFSTQLIGGAENQPNLNNPWFGPKLTRVYDGRLDADDVHAWYLAAAKGKTVKLFFLGGNRNPFLEQRTGWTVDGVEIKVRMDAQAKAIAWTGLYMNPGAQA